MGRHLSTGRTPGAVIICAEEFTLKPPAQIFLADEAQESATDNLMQRALDFRALYQVQEFYGRRDKDFYRFLSFLNADRRQRGLKTLETLEAPNSADGNINFPIGVLRARLSPNKKTIHLSGSKLLMAALQEFQMGTVSTAKDTEFPVLASLGYVVSALNEYGDYDRDRPEEAEMEYNFESIMDR